MSSTQNTHTSGRLAAVALPALLMLAAASVFFSASDVGSSAQSVGLARVNQKLTNAGELVAARSPAPGPYTYRWPVKPFDRQHPVRGFFGDPRIANHGHSKQFHFGVDISAPNGTPVFATL